MRHRLFVVVLLLAIPSAIDAAPIRWDLQDVRFNDGSIATGYFILDVDAKGRHGDAISARVGDYSITTTPSSLFISATYDYVPYFQTSLIAFRIASNVPGVHTLVFFLKAPLTDQGGVVEIFRVDESQDSAVQTRSIATGSLVGTPVSIPEPSLLTLLGVAAVALRRRFVR
jgi:hypothetical protein